MQDPVETASDEGAPSEQDRRRFRRVALVAMATSAVPYLWILWGGRLDPLRANPSGHFANFYDLQARSLFDGRWDVPAGTLGIEAFVVEGREYLYFGPFPSFLRMPVMAVTDRFDGRMTGPSMLLAWAVTGLFASLLIWRVRTMVRGSAHLSRTEAVGAGVLIATIATGSTVITLAAFPAVYTEAEAWGVALAIGALWGLLGVLEEPSTTRLIGTGALVLGASLSRLPLGYAGVIGAVLVAVLFATGRPGPPARSSSLRVLLVVAVIPVVLASAVNFAKFDSPTVQPIETQVFTQQDEHRQEMLEANGGRYYGPAFVPTTAWAYLRPDALRFMSVYPFVTMPEKASPEVGDVILDRVYRSSSVPASMPLLTVLSAAGVVAVVLGRRRGWARSVAVAILAGAAGTAGILLWGATAQRSLADFLPLLAVASAVGLTAAWRVLDRRSRRARVGALVIVGLLAGFGLVANFGIATEISGLSADGEWAHDYVDTQLAVSEVIGRAPDIQRRETLPAVGDPGQLVVVRDCAGLYLGTGEAYPPQWHAVDHGPGQRHLLDLTYRAVDQGPVPLLDVEPGATLSVEDRAFELTRWMRFVLDGQDGQPLRSRWVSIRPDTPYRVDVRTDFELEQVRVFVDDDDVAYWGDVPISGPARPVPDDHEAIDIEWREVPQPSLCGEPDVGS